MSAKNDRLPVRLHVEIVLFPQAMVGQGMALVDALRVVNTVMALQEGALAKKVTWQLVDEHGSPLEPPTASGPWQAVFAPYSGGPSGPGLATTHEAVHRACVILPFFASNLPALRKTVAAHAVLTENVQTWLNEGHTVVTLGNGVWFAAGAVQAGGRAFAVPWFYLAGFRTDFPRAMVRAGLEVTQDGPFISGASLEAWVGALLALLARVYPNEFVQTVQATFVFDAARQMAAAQAATDGVVQPTRDSVLALAVEWLTRHQAEPYDLAVLSGACKVSSRTLLRHFEQVLGMSPLDYLHRQRCQRACYLLETTLESVHSIAQNCGYADASGFRKVFLRHVGCSPQVYRSQRSLRTSRARWKTDGAEASVDKGLGSPLPD